MVISQDAVESMYYASYFSTHVIIDDVYLGILAYKLGIKPTHSDKFVLWDTVKARLCESEISYRSTWYVIFPFGREDCVEIKPLVSLHGLRSPQDLQNLWKEMKSSGIVQ